MPGKLLILSFHGHKPGPSGEEPLLDEDMLFKREAITSGLVAGDAMDEPGAMAALHPSLFEDPKAGIYSGLEEGRLGSTRLISLNKVGGNAWWRPPYLRKKDPAQPGRRLPSLFGTWLRKVFETPVEVLVLSGHQERGDVWGAEDKAVKKRYYTALRPVVAGNRSLLEVRGYKLNREPGETDLLREGPFDLTATLATCRLVVVLGCNGITDAMVWRSWVKNAAGKAPFILGWYHLHELPKNRLNEHFSGRFWQKLKGMAPGSDLGFLHEPDFEMRIIKEAWVAALNESFDRNGTQRHLLFDMRSGHPRGAGAVTPGGRVFRVKDGQGNVEEREPLP